MMLCPACATTDGQPNLQIDGYPLLDCDSCGHRFLEITDGESHVAAVYGEDYFEDGGNGYPGYLSMGKSLHARGRKYAAAIAPKMESGTLLDVGSGAGFLLKGFIDSGWGGEGVEPNASMVAHGREELGLNLHTSSFESFETDQRYDLVTLIQVMGHLYDPGESWEKLSRLVKPGGHVLVETWDKDSFTARLLKRYWHEYSPPSVVNWFSRASLAQLAERNGFTEVESRRTSKTITFGHAGSLLAHKFRKPRLLSRALASMRHLPGWLRVPYPCDDLFWSLFQNSDPSAA